MFSALLARSLEIAVFSGEVADEPEFRLLSASAALPRQARKGLRLLLGERRGILDVKLLPAMLALPHQQAGAARGEVAAQDGQIPAVQTLRTTDFARSCGHRLKLLPVHVIPPGSGLLVVLRPPVHLDSRRGGQVPRNFGEGGEDQRSRAIAARFASPECPVPCGTGSRKSCIPVDRCSMGGKGCE